MPITVDIRREFVEGFVPLSLHVARNLIRAGLPLEEAVNCKVDIYRLTSLYDGQVCPDRPPTGWRNEQWERVLEILREVLRHHEADADSSAFEREGYEVLRPHLEAAFERDVAKWPRIEDRPYGFFTRNNCLLLVFKRRTGDFHLLKSNSIISGSRLTTLLISPDNFQRW